VQLYNEKIFDLLNSQSQKAVRHKQISGLKLKFNPITDEVIVENVFNFECSQADDALKYF
jgi:hypothetical protein